MSTRDEKKRYKRENPINGPPTLSEYIRDLRVRSIVRYMCMAEKGKMDYARDFLHQAEVIDDPFFPVGMAITWCALYGDSQSIRELLPRYKVTTKVDHIGWAKKFAADKGFTEAVLALEGY